MASSNFRVFAVHVHKMAVTYSAVWLLLSSPLQTVLLAISSEPVLCEISHGTQEGLHQTRFLQPPLLHVHGDTPVVSYQY